MAVRLGEFIIYGRLRNVNEYETRGYLVLRSEDPEEPVCMHIELTGNCDPDLQGKIFCFYPPDQEAPGPAYDLEKYGRIQLRQIGATGTMTAQGWVRALPCSAEDYLRRSRLGEPPPTEWTRHLYLEWYGQNGRVVVEMAGAMVQECIREGAGREDPGDWIDIPNEAPHPEEFLESERMGGLDISEIHIEDGVARVDTWTPVSDDPNTDEDMAILQRRLDAEAAATERAMRGQKVDETGIEELELMDYCMENGEEVPVRELLGDLDKLPRPEDLDDDEVEIQLKSLLAEMAMAGLRLHICKHFTPRDAYRLLLDEILDNSTGFRELGGTGWVQNFMTDEYCEACEAEMEAEWREYEQKKKEADGDQN